jgi:hypothetical protein
MTKRILYCLIAIISSQLFFAQNNVTGLVTDNGGVPLPGASVIIKGTNNGGITNFDGEFDIVITQAECILEVSYLGMKTSEVVYNGQKVINVILEEEISRLDQVVVVGYQEIKKRDVFYASTIFTKKIGTLKFSCF